MNDHINWDDYRFSKHTLNINYRNKLEEQIFNRIQSHVDDGYHLFGASVTYKHIEGKSHTEESINRLFHNMYFKALLPKYIFESKKWVLDSKSLQPFIYYVPERGGPFYKQVSKDLYLGLDTVSFADSYHHHAIFAVRPEHEKKCLRLCGENTLRKFSDAVMTSFIEPVDIGWCGYTIKNSWRDCGHPNIYGPMGLTI